MTCEGQTFSIRYGTSSIFRAIANRLSAFTAAHPDLVIGAGYPSFRAGIRCRWHHVLACARDVPRAETANNEGGTRLVQPAASGGRHFGQDLR